MSYKKSKSIHVNRPEIGEIKKWQKETKRHILRLKRQDYTILQQDECMVHADDNAGYRNWTPVGRPQVVRYNGRRQKVIVFGAIAADGRSLFRT